LSTFIELCPDQFTHTYTTEYLERTSSLIMAVFHYCVAVLAFIVNLPSVVFTEEQKCYTKFEYEYNVIEQLIILKQKLERQERVSVDLQQELYGKICSYL
jgi:hypothetical protein